jgi:glycosyltransferase involved in cell wall biosynthesis
MNSVIKKKRILFLLPSLNGGGAERVVLTLLQHLDRERFEPILVLMEEKGRYLGQVPEDIEMIDLQATQARYAIIKILRIVNQKRPDILFTTLAYLNLLIALFRPLLPANTYFIARESNTVSVRNRREKYPRLFDWLYRKVYNRFDAIVAQANYMKKDLVENYAIDADRIHVIYNPVDTKSVRGKAVAGRAAFKEGKINLLAIGKLEYQKGYDLLLESMHYLDEAYHVTILGEGSWRERLETEIKKRGLQERVMLAGFSANPYAWMQRADLLLLPSRYEGLPNVVLEAHAVGLPVVAYDSPGGTGEIVKEGFNGFLVTPFDTKAFADTIEKALCHPFDKEMIIEATKRDFDVQKVARRYEQLFNEPS